MYREIRMGDTPEGINTVPRESLIGKA